MTNFIIMPPPRLTQVLDKDLVPVFEGRTAKVDQYLEKNPKVGSWVRLGRSGRIMTVEDYMREDGAADSC
jgi:hypothetical protein